ncbi:unnamed protein product [Chrysoparadoxa australica]
MVRKKVDSRVRTLIENGVRSNHRSLFVIVGDHAKDQVVNLHYILSKARVAARPSVLWCYKKELGFSTHRKKRMRQLKRQQKHGLTSSADDEPFELFVTSTDIRWSYYKDTHKVLGQTFGMLVLQDFEALTPNLLARTVETVEGGGMVCLLMKSVESVQQLFTMAMDVHDRFRTESHDKVVCRFNERFMLSLGDCRSCLILDDELNVLPLSSHAKGIKALPPTDEGHAPGDSKDLRELKASLEETVPIGPLVSGARTLDQARALLTFMEAISEKTLRSTVALTAARGRGKSAAIGLCLAGAVAYGYSNVFVTSPSPENLGTVFEFVMKGFDLLSYSEHMDYEVIQSTDPGLNKSVVRINIFRDHRQTIQYIQPHDSAKLSHCELLAIDEAAAIPLPLVKDLMGPYVIFMSSTINGYEGTGRSLSLKLLDQLRRQQGNATAAAAAAAAGQVHGSGKMKGKEKVHEERWKMAAEAAANAAAHGGGAGVGRVLREISLSTPIRYGEDDPVEKWLYQVLCLDAKASSNRLVMGTPAPSDCELFYVDRDALFSYHKLSESFLQRVMALYTAAHYKNQPNDLQLMSDAPAHRLFVLLGPRAMEDGEEGKLPDVLCVLQVALEGKISRESVQAANSRGQKAFGDLIPWTLSQQFQDNGFPGLSGARIVRLATHPDVQSMGYGSRALQLLIQYYQGELVSLDEDEGESSDDDDSDSSAGEEEEEANGAKKVATSLTAHSGLATAKLKPRKKLPPLLVPVSNRKPEGLHWLGVSYGITAPLLRFWKRAKMGLVYLRQTTADLTGEHTGIMLRELRSGAVESAPQKGWLEEFVTDCRRRLVKLFSFSFKEFDTVTALTLVDSKASVGKGGSVSLNSSNAITPAELAFFCTPHDLHRLELYARNMVDHHLITDLLPALCQLYFLGKIPGVHVSYLQGAILLGMGLQHRTVSELTVELQLPDNQVLALFNKAVRKICTALKAVQEQEAAAELDHASSKAKKKQVAKAAKGMVDAQALSMGEEQEGAAQDALTKMKQKNREVDVPGALDLGEYAVKGSDQQWEQLEKMKGGSIKSVQMKTKAVAEGVVKEKSKKKRKKSEGEALLKRSKGETGEGEGRRRKSTGSALAGGDRASAVAATATGEASATKKKKKRRKNKEAEE